MKQDVMTTREAAARLGISLRRLMALIAAGKLPGSFKVGLLRYIPREVVEARLRWKERRYARAK